MAARSGCVCVNGRMLAPEQASVSALDAGFLLGDGLFESLRASGGVPYLLQRHLARLYGATVELGFAGLPAPEALAQLVNATLERAALDEAYLRVTVTRGCLPRALAKPTGPPTIVIAALPAPPRAGPTEAIEVALVGPPAALGPSAKSTSRQSAVLALRAVEPTGCREGVYVREGRVLEGISSNLFAVCDGCLLTPPVADCLPGVTRGRVLELARERGLPVLETTLTLARLWRCEQVFATNAVQGLRAIEAIDGRPVEGSQQPSSGVFETLFGLYEADRRAVREQMTSA